MTFNPGWTQHADPLSSFSDVHELQRQLKAQGLVLKSAVDEAGSRPASFVVIDPDGNPVLVDQHL